jgi:hypothetical protein
MNCTDCDKEIDTEFTEDKVSQCEVCWSKGCIIDNKWWPQGDQGGHRGRGRKK